MTVACASRPTVSEFQCKAGDWETIGFRDGASGLQSTRLLEHQEACGEFSIVPDRSRYMAGWHTGMIEYCNPDNGFGLGKQGKRIQSICQGKWRAPFAAAYEKGQTLFLARKEVDRIGKQLQKYNVRLEQIQQKLVDLTSAQINTSLTSDARLQMLSEMESLTREREEIKHLIPVVEEKLYENEIRLEQLEKSLKP